jgi:hypothetical protein
MFDFKFKQYRKDIHTVMSYLIGFDEDYHRQMLATYPGTEVAIRDHFKQKTAHMECAAHIWGAMFADQFETSPELKEDTHRMERYIFDCEGEPKLKIEQMARTFLVQASVQLKLGVIDDITFNYVATEIMGALHGMGRKERSSRRVAAHVMGQRAEA